MLADGPAARHHRAVETDELIEVHRIASVKYRYLRCLDQKRWDEIESCFVADATASYGGGAYTLRGRAAIIDFLRTSMGSQTMLTSHRCHHPEIEVSGPEASGVWAFDDVVVETREGWTLRGAGFYEDRYRLGTDGWRIVHTGYRRTFEELGPRARGSRITADWWATDGRSTLG